MMVQVFPEGEAPFQIDVDEGSEIGQLKETIEALIQKEAWTATSMRIFYGQIELQNTSTLQQNGISEFGILHVTCEAHHQGALSFPTEDSDMLSNYGDDGGFAEFNLDDLLNLPAARAHLKLLLPQNFQAHLLLNHTRTHHFQNAGQLRDKIDKDPPNWLPKLEVYAMLSNAAVFLVEDMNDLLDRENGRVALVRSSSFGDSLQQGEGYNFTTEAPLAITIEKPAGKFKISGEISLDRFEITGDLWTRRRIHIAGDDTHSLIQWMSAKPKRKDTVKDDVSKAVKAVDELKFSLDAVATDVTDIKKDVASIMQGFTQMHTTIAALADRLPHQPPRDHQQPDPDT